MAHRRVERTRLARRALAVLLAGGAVVAVAASAGVEAGCSAKDAPKSTSPDAIPIGVSLALTGGELDTFAAPLRDVVRVAESQINANGGVLGRPVVFKFNDDGGESGDRLTSGIRSLLEKDKVLGLIGPIGSGQVAAAHSITQAAKVLLLAPSATATSLSAAEPAVDRYLFRTTPNDDFQAKAVVKLALQGPTVSKADAGAPVSDASADAGPAPPPGPFCKSIAVAYIDNDYGRGMADTIATLYPKQGGTVAAKVELPEKSVSSYESQVNAILGSTPPSCIVLIAYEKIGARFMIDLRAKNTSVLVFGTDGIFTPGFITASKTGTEFMADGVYGTNPDTNPQSNEFVEFKKVYNAYFPGEPPTFTANTYDAAILIALAIQRAGTTADKARIRDALYDVSAKGTVFGPSQYGEAVQAMLNGIDIDYKGASGDCDFSDNGDVKGGFIVWKVEKGAFLADPVRRFKPEDLEGIK